MGLLLFFPSKREVREWVGQRAGGCRDFQNLEDCAQHHLCLCSWKPWCGVFMVEKRVRYLQTRRLMRREKADTNVEGLLRAEAMLAHLSPQIKSGAACFRKKWLKILETGVGEGNDLLFQLMDFDWWSSVCAVWVWAESLSLCARGALLSLQLDRDFFQRKL